MIDVLRIAHLRIAPQEGNLEVGNCEGNRQIGFSPRKKLIKEGSKYFPTQLISRHILGLFAAKTTVGYCLVSTKAKSFII